MTDIPQPHRWDTVHIAGCNKGLILHQKSSCSSRNPALQRRESFGLEILFLPHFCNYMQLLLISFFSRNGGYKYDSNMYQIPSSNGVNHLWIQLMGWSNPACLLSCCPTYPRAAYSEIYMFFLKLPGLLLLESPPYTVYIISNRIHVSESVTHPYTIHNPIITSQLIGCTFQVAGWTIPTDPRNLDHPVDILRWNCTKYGCNELVGII